MLLPIRFGKNDSAAFLIYRQRIKRCTARLIVNKVKRESIVQGAVIGRLHQSLCFLEHGLVSLTETVGENLVASVLDVAVLASTSVGISTPGRAVKSIRPDDRLLAAVEAIGVHLFPLVQNICF